MTSSKVTSTSWKLDSPGAQDAFLLESLTVSTEYYALQYRHSADWVVVTSKPVSKAGTTPLWPLLCSQQSGVTPYQCSCIYTTVLYSFQSGLQISAIINECHNRNSVNNILKQKRRHVTNRSKSYSFFLPERSTNMSNRENYSESSFYPVEYQNQGEWLRPDSQEHRTANYLHHLPQEHHEERSHSVDHTGKHEAFSCESSIIFIKDI